MFESEANGAFGATCGRVRAGPPKSSTGESALSALFELEMSRGDLAQGSISGGVRVHAPATAA